MRKEAENMADMIYSAVELACRGVRRVLHAIDLAKKAFERGLTETLNEQAESLAAATGWSRHMEDRIMQEVMKQVHEEIGSLLSRLQ